MNAELAEIRDFLAQHLPFSLLDGEALDALPRHFSLRYLRRGSAFPPAAETTPSVYLIRSGAVECRDAEGALTETLCEGECFFGQCADEHSGAATAVEDTLLLLLPCTALRALRQQHPPLDEYMVQGTAQRLRHARRSVSAGGLSSGTAVDSASPARLMTLPVRDFIRRAPVTGVPTMSIRAAAQRMAEHQVSALLLLDDADQLCGIVTDRDLRSRCLAADLSPDTPVQAIMSHAPECIGPESAAFEALMRMTQKGVHHLPVADADGLRGLVTSTDLMRWQSANAAYLAGVVRAAQNLPDLARASADLPELQVRMQSHGATPRQVGLAISSINDAITGRLIELACAELGPPPVRFAWMACGSQGRHEQTVHSDQDNALILDDAYDPDTHGTYFEALATRVCDGLDACGFRYCPGKVMAITPDWRQPQRRWIAHFENWIGQPDKMAAMLAANFLDMRTVYGDPKLMQPVHAAIKAAAGGHSDFLARMLSNALSNTPPLGFFRHLTLISEGEHSDTLDIKRRGLIPITDLARIHALANGLAEVGTLARLHSGGASLLRDEARHELAEAFEYFGSLRLRHQAQQIRRGRPPDNYLSPAALTALERSNLKQAFTALATVQKALRQSFADRLPE